MVQNVFLFLFFVCLFFKINKSRTAWPTKILLPFLSFSDNICFRMIIFQNSANNFEISIISYKTCLILVWDALPP